MGAGNGDTMTVAHQLGEHFGTPYHGNTRAMCRGNLGILNSHRGGFDHHIGTVDILFAWPINTVAPALGQTLEYWVRADIGTGNFVALI